MLTPMCPMLQTSQQFLPLQADLPHTYTRNNAAPCIKEDTSQTISTAATASTLTWTQMHTDRHLALCYSSLYPPHLIPHPTCCRMCCSLIDASTTAARAMACFAACIAILTNKPSLQQQHRSSEHFHNPFPKATASHNNTLTNPHPGTCEFTKRLCCTYCAHNRCMHTGTWLQAGVQQLVGRCNAAGRCAAATAMPAHSSVVPSPVGLRCPAISCNAAGWCTSAVTAAAAAMPAHSSVVPSHVGLRCPANQLQCCRLVHVSSHSSSSSCCNALLISGAQPC